MLATPPKSRKRYLPPERSIGGRTPAFRSSALNTRTCAPRGAHVPGSVYVNTATVGAPSAAARCVTPESHPK